MGDIGEPTRRIELLPETEPVTQPVEVPAPAEPATPVKEPVPA